MYSGILLGWRSLRRELPEGKNRLKLRLNVGVKEANIRAHVEDGILDLTLPKADACKARKIKVNWGIRRMVSWAALSELAFFWPVYGGLFLTETTSFTLALQREARFPLRFPDPVDQEEVRPLASFYSKLTNQ